MKKLIAILSILIACLLLAGKLFDRCYKKFWWPFFEKLDVVIKDSTYYDGIYIGDSRVHFGINPYYVDSVTGLETYNTGMGGAPINEMLFLTKNYLQHHPAPKFAVISIGHSNLLRYDRSFQNPCYYLFYTEDSITNESLQNLHYHTSLYAILPVLKYTVFDDFNKLSITENLKGNSIAKPGGVVYRGFINNTTNSFNMKELENTVQSDTAIHPGLTLLEETIKLFADKNTIPILVYPPSTHLHGNSINIAEQKIDSAIAKLAIKYHAPVLHFDTDTSFTNELFTDGWHLNIKGTILYSIKIGEQIKTILNNRSFKNN